LKFTIYQYKKEKGQKGHKNLFVEMKVLHICPGFFATDLYRQLFLALDHVGVVNEIFTLPYKDFTAKGEKNVNITVLDKEFNLLQRIIYFKKQLTIFRTIRSEYAFKEFQIVHAHTLFSAGFTAMLLKKKLGVPYIVAIRNTDVNVFFKYMLHLRILGRLIMNNAQNIIFLSPSYRDYVIQKYVSKKRRPSMADKSVVIPNGIDEYFLDNKFTLKRTINTKIIRLIYVGTIDSNKNIETTIKACEMLIENGYSVTFTIVGEILHSKYHRILPKYGFIDYYPSCPKEEVVLYLRKADIFVMPSKLETFGLVYAEAMSQGLPLIYSKGQGFDGQFENGIVGYAVDSFDYKDISQKVIDLYNNYQQFSERSLSLADKFNWSAIASEYMRIYG
jgi:glycosyltransferase involved in cell wall biosynthesis